MAISFSIPINIMVTIAYIIICVLLFSLAIAIHEFGHFIVALKLGLRVESFSIGFGPVLWKRKVNGVEYRISAIPLGGYVSIPDVDPEGTKVLEGGGDKARVKIPAWKEILVAVAGPLMNVVLAVVLAVMLSLIPQVKFGELSTEISDVLKDSPAEQAGLIGGDKIIAVGQNQVATWMELMTEIQICGGKATQLTIERGAETNVVSIVAKQDEASGAFYIGAVRSNGDGIGHFLPARNPLKQLAWDASSIFRILKGLITPKDARATSKALGGPVMIAESLYYQIRHNPFDAIGFLRYLNVNLAILNLLPIPVLDGGLIMFALFALIFRRRIPDSIIKYISMAFVVVLMGLMGLLIIRDSLRSYRIHTFKAKEITETVDVHSQPDSSSENR